MSETAVKSREAKDKGEKERYTHLNAEFQRTARRDKKAFLSDQCKETEENISLGDSGSGGMTWSSSGLSCGERLLLRCDGNAGNSTHFLSPLLSGCETLQFSS